MAEESKRPFDPEATVRQPAGAIDPDATPTAPVSRLKADDPEATVQRMPAFDPDATAPKFDPEATFNPAQRAALEDPEATIRIPSPGRKRKPNPFAPHARPENLQANLAALGGLNPLIALANPVLGVVPQIRRALKHPDPAQLRATLRDQIESFQTSATFADIPGRQVEWAVYAMCALLDESAASTPWGADWAEKGLLHEMRSEDGAGEGFFALLGRLANDPDGNAELIEFFYVCMALGFEGRFQGSDRHELTRVRDRTYALISRRRPRPRDGLSERWRSPLDPLAAKAAEAPRPQTPVPAAPIERVRAMPFSAKLSAGAAILGTVLVGYMVAIRLPDFGKPSSLSQRVAQKTVAATPASPAVATEANLVRDLGAAASVAEKGGVVRIELRNDRQFAVGAVRPGAELRPLIERVGKALDRAPGTIVVVGHADAVQGVSRSNQEISLARARAVTRILAGSLADPKRVRAEGKGDADPAVPNDSDANRARNRRVVIELRPGP
jgi:type VI secretion system protein ImpK